VMKKRLNLNHCVHAGEEELFARSRYQDSALYRVEIRDDDASRWGNFAKRMREGRWLPGNDRRVHEVLQMRRLS
jgi:hypothetical protein